jgi:uncharacterized membrane protein YbjE (DUF340 family)
MKKLSMKGRIGIFLFGIGAGIIGMDIYRGTYDVSQGVLATLLILIGIGLYFYEQQSE